MMYEMTVIPFTRTLTNLNHILSKGIQYSEAKKIDFAVLLNSRLAPDQFNLARQIQIACDTAKLCVSRMTGKEAPAHDDQKTELVDLQKRIQDVLQYLTSIETTDFNESETKKITHPRWENKWMQGQDYVIHHALPNFYFHITTAYSVLRHNGVDIGKKDYLGELPFKV